MYITDLNAAPGSQNGMEHSSSRDGSTNWPTSPEYISQSLDAIDFLASRNLNASGDGRCATALLLDHAHVESYISSKKRKVSLKQKDSLEPYRSNVVNEMTDDQDLNVHGNIGLLNHDNCFMETIQACQDEAIDAGHIHQGTEAFFEKMTGEHIMKLLELDDPDNEEQFRMEIEMPLSPTLPEIEMHSVKSFEMDEFTISKEGIYGGMVNEFDGGILSRHFGVSNVEIYSD